LRSLDFQWRNDAAFGVGDLVSYARSYSSFDPYGGLTEEEELSADGPYWLRHWRGQLPLARSYWVNGFLVNVATFAGQAFILGLAQTRQLAPVAWSFVIFVVLALALRVWSFVGIWRSAGRHVLRGGSAFWAFAARAVIVLGVIGLVVTAPQLWSQVREMALIASGNDPIGKPAVIKVSPSGDEITLDGYITSGVGKTLSKALDGAPNARTLTLNSHGGRIMEALAMADLIRTRNLDTRVIEDCESACTLLFLAGHERSASPLAAIGFHQPDFPGLSPAERDEMIQSNREDYRAAGISNDFIDSIMATSPEKMWYPSGQEMTDAGVLNAVVVSGRRSDRDLSRLNQVLHQAVSNINARRGAMIDDVTRLQGAQLNGQDIVVDYVVMKAVHVSPAQFSKAMTPVVRSHLCAGTDAALISSGGKYRFNYRYEKGGSVGTVLIDHC
jgi:ATP-dependent protease ClpP protease subunit